MFEVKLFCDGVMVGWLNNESECCEEVELLSEDDVKDLLFSDWSNIGFADIGVSWLVVKVS